MLVGGTWDGPGIPYLTRSVLPDLDNLAYVNCLAPPRETVPNAQGFTQRKLVPCSSCCIPPR